jgi:hypothetical protein
MHLFVISLIYLMNVTKSNIKLTLCYSNSLFFFSASPFLSSNCIPELGIFQQETVYGANFPKSVQAHNTGLCQLLLGNPSGDNSLFLKPSGVTQSVSWRIKFIH